VFPDRIEHDRKHGKKDDNANNQHEPMQKELGLLLKCNDCTALVISLACFIELFNLLLQKVLG
jgi:hypothetical protein